MKLPFTFAEFWLQVLINVISPIYFQDKFPPLDLVVESGVVIPTLVRYLSRYDAPLLQTECAWSITNIACGEARHIKCLVDNGAIQELLIVLNTTGALSLKEQILWALCNISTDEGGARFMMAIPDVLLVVLRQIGIYCPSYSRVETDNSMMDGERLPSTIDIFQAVAGQPPSKPTADYLPHRAVSRITQFEMNTIPSLSTMRHVTFICGNLARSALTHLLFCALTILQSAAAASVAELLPQHRLRARRHDPVPGKGKRS